MLCKFLSYLFAIVKDNCLPANLKVYNIKININDINSSLKSPNKLSMGS